MDHTSIYEEYSLDMETLRQNEDCTDIDGVEQKSEKNPNWNQDQEGYYYGMQQSFQGIPVYFGVGVDGVNDINNFDSMPLQVFQTKSGIENIDLMDWFIFEQKQDKVVLMPIEQILQTLEEKYTAIKSEDTIKVARCELYEYPLEKKEGEYEMNPIWLCRLDIIDGQGYEYSTYIPIHAVTGEEMLEIEVN